MEGNEMAVAFENRVFSRRAGLGGGRMGCTLVTGFLGSGKTTLLRHVLDNRADLRVAVLVNEFADSDIDSAILDSTRLNAAFNLPAIFLTHGCVCCNVRGPFRESLRQIVDSKHNFDCVIIETSGLARPDKFVAELEEFGIHLDAIVAVVDAESLDKILRLDIVRQQLQHVDLVLLNKCDLATLGQISDAEDTLEVLTGGAKIVRSQFCKVPLDLLIDHVKIKAVNGEKEYASFSEVLSHESFSKSRFQGDMFDRNSGAISSVSADIERTEVADKWTSKDTQTGLSHEQSFSSVTFEREVPLSLAVFHSIVLTKMRGTKGLLRAKGILWFVEDSQSRFVFQWSGIKRVEAVSKGPWESSPKSCLVLIGIDKSELEDINVQLSRAAYPQKEISSGITCHEEFARRFAMKVATDGRFKEPCLTKKPLVIFGLKGSSLRGIKEFELNEALMRVINGKGNIFLIATSSYHEYNLQLLLDETSDPDGVWDEVRVATSLVVSKLCRNFCPCRSDLTAHIH